VYSALLLTSIPLLPTEADTLFLPPLSQDINGKVVVGVAVLAVAAAGTAAYTVISRRRADQKKREVKVDAVQNTPITAVDTNSIADHTTLEVCNNYYQTYMCLNPHVLPSAPFLFYPVSYQVAPVVVETLKSVATEAQPADTVEIIVELNEEEEDIEAPVVQDGEQWW